MTIPRIFIPLVTALLLLPACGRSNAGTSGGHQVELKYSRLLSMTDYDSYTVAEIRNPWDTAAILCRYVLLPRDAAIPNGVNPQQVLRVPLTRSIVYSSVHNGLISELGAGASISGVCDSRYIYEPNLVKRLESGDLADCGSSMSPNVERIIQLSPQAILLSPFENSGGHGKLSQASIPIVECADYMESSPLARAEWMKFYGRLYGAKERADSLFTMTENAYLALKNLTDTVSFRPKVLIDRIYGQSWNVPGGCSTMGTLLNDAGAVNPFGDRKVSGSLSLSPEKVLYEADDADFWLIRYSYSPLTLKSLADDKDLYTRFKAYRDGNVYGSDSSTSRIFEDLAFHPHWLLADMISIFHPEISLPPKHKNYFTRLQ